MACPLCGSDACIGHTSNRTGPVGYGMFGPEPGPPTGPNSGYARVYEGIDGMWTADRRLYLDASGKVVEEGDPGRVSLLIAKGQSMPEARARELGLIEEKALAPKANKAKTRAPENKAGGG